MDDITFDELILGDGMKFEDMQADFESHPIEGYLHTGERLHVPLISQITDHDSQGNLFVGGCVNGVDLGDFFSHIFSLYMWEQYKYAEGTVHTEVKMYDSRSHPIDVETVESMSDAVVNALAEGGNVLVHCQAGINRSNLIASRALMKMGHTAAEAIAILRKQRSPLVLANKTFENYLLGFDAYEASK